MPVNQIWVVFKQLGEPGKVSVRTTGEGKPDLDLEPFLQCNVATTQRKFNVATLSPIWQLMNSPHTAVICGGCFEGTASMGHSL